jgi:hypothetical protein
VEEVIAEDFGWCVMVHRQPFRLWVGCANLDPGTTRWQMFIATEQRPLARLFRKVDTAPAVSRLREHLQAIVLEVPDITDIEWEDDGS